MLLQRNFLSLALAAGVLGLASCNKGGDFSKTKSGIEYKVFKGTNGKYDDREVSAEGDPTYKDRVGKIMALHVEYRTAKDSILFNSRKQQMGFPVRVPLDSVRKEQRGGLEEAISLLQPGDSAVFRFNVDTIFAKSFRQPVPPFMKKAGNTMTMYVKVDKVQTRDEAMADVQKMQVEQQQKMQAYAETQLKKDDVTLQDYIKKNSLNAQKDASGVYVAVTQPGTGPKPKQGQVVSVQYKGTLLDGKEFDSSAKGNQGKPIEFPIGVGQVIPGWDKAIPLLNKGSKAVLLIPSSLAYGQRGAGANIPADAILRFDVELVDVKNAPAAPAGQPNAADIQRQLEEMQRQQQGK
ncbi:FKBP-type peptidyl-prolyl cis-trans isomerase [Hymenobacter sp. 5516J-16]|uniref:peptidylprolyl isomerase n=1 Tax=Hymenobacter sublimis TaxID=2933777 RepID=A0ABY4J9T2_9BACT|nr:MULTISPECIES: FKBP-type peptidyl-prolyl cis-trans isomerase [Hymenobacter]UOQ75890.1 FKBP-type peptidyl-prolyl cis-trans isomerase [Hymenobacter sp. 5516J-16]UPL49566.1 FKBP-type peptidyl-prolyl cis-trans isomerase [Hymenobacter sublimis]